MFSCSTIMNTIYLLIFIQSSLIVFADVAHWGPWRTLNQTACSVTCHAGTLMRYDERSCLGENTSECGDEAKRAFTETCTLSDRCPEDGHWSAWRIVYVSMCTASCKRQVDKVRMCDDPLPSPGGEFCKGYNDVTVYEDCIDDQCKRVDGKWSSWRKHLSRCSSSCNRTVNVTRRCNSPAPAGLGLECIGIDFKTFEKKCVGGLCTGVDGQWTPWIVQSSGPCMALCKKLVNKKRTCTNPAPFGTGLDCNGTSSNFVGEYCTGGECIPVDGKWAEWVKLPTDSPCPFSCVRPITAIRNCSNPAPLGGGLQCPGKNITTIIDECRGDSCVRVGIWSAWKKQALGRCLANCSKKMFLSRNCKSPGLYGACTGNKSKVVYEDCIDDKCGSFLKSEISKENLGYIIFACVAVIISIPIIFLYCRFKRSVEKKAQMKNKKVHHSAANTKHQSPSTHQHNPHGHAKDVKGMENTAFEPDETK